MAQWVAAGVTFAAVLVALFKDEFLRRWRRPELQVSIKLQPPDCHKMTITRMPDGLRADCYYLRLWIKNTGKTRAEQVQVFADKLLRESADGSFRDVHTFLPMNLQWAHGHEIFAIGISPQMGKHCDLGRIINPALRKQFGDDLQDLPDTQPILGLDLEFKASTMGYLVRPGKYQLQLKIAGSNANVVRKTIEITLKESWFDAEARMYTEGLGIKILPFRASGKAR